MKVGLLLCFMLIKINKNSHERWWIKYIAIELHKILNEEEKDIAQIRDILRNG